MSRSLRTNLAIGLIAVGCHPAEHVMAEDTERPWSVGFGGGVASTYGYRTLNLSSGDLDQSFGSTWMPSLGVNRRLGAQSSLQAGIDYFAQEDRGQALSVQIASFGVGIRQSFDQGQSVRPYVELMPAFYVGHWVDDLTSYSLTSVRPGLIAGLGFVGPLTERVRLDVGIQGQLSTGWPEVGHWPSELREPDYRGVNRVMIRAKILYGI